jgi:hypothetical protein
MPEAPGLLIWGAVQPSSRKYFCSLPTQITSHIAPVSFHLKGRIAIVTNAGRDAVDASGASDEGAQLADGEAVWS